ncbi:arylsulfatase [Streptomyces sp. NPDC048643]|uniref:arylsulfatase n=1 Tax=Streptomyces sp. NPDC048643 TaxID=3155637 RepID=UPI00343D96E7
MTDATADTAIPYPDPPFTGHIGRTYQDSTPDYPQPAGPPAGAPNVLLILLDDIGFGQASVSGGPAATPHMEALAATGVSYNQFHTTSLCSPTRAALLTGRNHHRVGFGTITEGSSGYPGYNCALPRSAASIGAIMTANGYSTAWFGKNHNTPDWESSAVGPFDRWPTGLGFEYFYGFLGGETSQWEPQLYEQTTPVEPPADESYHLTEDLVERTRMWITQQKSLAPEKPFFAYLATGALHSPHHVPKPYIERYKGAFDHGWDRERELTLERQKAIGIVPADTELTAKPEGIADWDSLPEEEKRLFARMQEVFAGFVTHTDDQVGRLLGVLDELGIRDDTLVVLVVGDNGPSAEGGPAGTVNAVAAMNGLPDTVDFMLPKIDELGSRLHDNHYPVGWAWAGATPFAWMKQVASHFGGTRNLAAMSWPGRIPADGVRPHFHHIIDILPTILDAAGIPTPTHVDGIEQLPVDGVSMAYSWPSAKIPPRRTTQYFEHGGNRALYHDGWIASARHGVPWQLIGKQGDFDHDPWELYDLSTDFSQARDLAARHPDKVEEYQRLFDQEAWDNNVYPLDDRFAERANDPLRPSMTRGRTVFTYYPGTTRVPEGSAPKLYPRSHRITAHLTVPDGGARGVLVTQGGRGAGYSLYLDDDGRLVHHYNFFDRAHWTVTTPSPVPAGDIQVGLEFMSDHDDKLGSGGIIRLAVDGRTTAESRIQHSVPARYSATETFDIGRNTGSPVTPAYQGANPFTGHLQKLTIEITG